MAGIEEEEFGQKIDLTVRIREILRNYPSGVSILKELIQNSDDAGARMVRFCYDRRQHGTEAMAYRGLEAFQGPALLCFNDAVFSESDFESIQNIGNSAKKAALAKTGRFGLGFNAVYHFTDLPSFVSGKYLVYFDPSACHLPNVNPSNPGKRIDFAKTGDLGAKYKDQFLPYCAFGNNMATPFQGTLFRFPLRSKQQGATSKLSKHDYGAKEMAELLADFVAEAPSMLLFLKSVEHIQFLDWAVGDAAPVCQFAVSIANLTPALRAERAFPASIVNLATQKERFFMQKTDIQTTMLTSDGKEEKELDTWLISNAFCEGEPKQLSLETSNEWLKLLPWGGVAARVSRSGQDQTLAVKGQAFCFLPLPVSTALPAHLNGYFELSSNRRDIWWGSDMAGDGKAIWNRALLRTILARCYCEMIKEALKVINARKITEENQRPEFGAYNRNLSDYYSLWPIEAASEPWALTRAEIYKLLLDLPVVYSELNKSWLTPRQAVFVVEESETKHCADNSTLASILVRGQQPIVQLPRKLWLLLREANSSLVVATPKFVRNWLTKSGLPKQLTWEDGLFLLRYCLSDLTKESYAELVGVPLVPLVSKSFGKFAAGTVREELYFLVNEVEVQLLSKASTCLVALQDDDFLRNHFSTAELQKATNVKRLNDEAFVSLLSLELPAAWKGKTVVDWDSKQPGQPTPEWVTKLWEFISASQKLAVFDGWPLVPAVGSKLCRLHLSSHLIDSHREISPVFQELLTKIGFHCLDHSFPWKHAQKHTFVQKLTISGVLAIVTSLVGGDMKKVKVLFENANPDERIALRSFLTAQMFGNRELVEPAGIELLKMLPIFEVFSKSEKVEFCDLSSERLIPPPDTNPVLLTPRFLNLSAVEDLKLAQTLGARQTSPSEFYRNHVFTNLQALPTEIRDDVMQQVLRDMPMLFKSDPQFSTVLKALAFVPDLTDSLHKAADLFDPSVPEL